MTTITRDFAASRRIWRRPMATPAFRVPTGQETTERVLLVLVAILGLIIVLRFVS